MKPQTVEEYIASLHDYQKARIVEVRNALMLALPYTVETLKWGSPAILTEDGMILVVYSAHKDHMNLVGTPSTLNAFRDKLLNYETGKGSIKVPYDRPLSKELIKDFVLYRFNEYRQSGVKWK